MMTMNMKMKMTNIGTKLLRLRGISSSSSSSSYYAPPSSSSSSTSFATRSFFASSTDHTTLLSNATVHCITQDPQKNNSTNNLTKQYILLPHDTPIDLAIKVDKLHLARLNLYTTINDNDNNGDSSNSSTSNSNTAHVLHGAKVVQRSLGTLSDVCQPLVEQALKDISNSNNNDSGDTTTVAFASLHGLCKWTSNSIEQIENNNNDNGNGNDEIINILSKWKENDTKTYEAVKSIATGIPRPGHSVVGQGTYRDAEEGWKEIAMLFESEEGELYRKNGGVCVDIQHLGDVTTEGLMYAGGAMAKFEFEF